MGNTKFDDEHTKKKKKDKFENLGISLECVVGFEL